MQVSVQSLLDDDEKEAVHVDWYEPKVILFREFLNGIESWMGENPNGKSDVLDGAVGPMDSVSQATDKSSKSSRKSTRVSSKSKVSASAAFLQMEVERAALKAKAQALEKKHVLDMEEAQLKAKKKKKSLRWNLKWLQLILR